MKQALLAGCLVAAMAAAAEAQTTFGYSRRDHDSSFTLTYSSGYGYGYGCGPGVAYGPGFVGTYRGGTFTFGTYHAGFGGFCGYPGMGGYGMPYGGVESSFFGYGGAGFYGTMGHYGPPTWPRVSGADYVPPAPAARGVADRGHELVSAKEIDEGRRRFKAGDYRGALDGFRSAVVADTSSVLAQAWFAVALAVTGDPRNADKALRGASSRGAVPKLDLKDAFRDDKERARVMAAAAGSGSLTGAWMQAQAGDPAKLKDLAAKDPSAKKLLE